MTYIVIFIIVFLIVEAVYYRRKRNRLNALENCRLYRKVEDNKINGRNEPCHDCLLKGINIKFKNVRSTIIKTETNNIKIFYQTRKNTIIFFFGKIMCKLFGHQDSFDREEINVDLDNKSGMCMGLKIARALKPIKVCPRCFKVIDLESTIKEEVRKQEKSYKKFLKKNNSY